MDFEAKALDVCRALGASAPRPEAVALVADALRAAALDEGAREAPRAELAGLLAEVRGRALNPPFTVSVDPGEAASWDAPTHPMSVADMEAAISATILNAATSLTTPPQSALTHLLERLCWLLGLSDGERRFVKMLADDAGDFDGLQVFSDWLEDQGRTADGARLRRLVPKDGDVLVLRVPPAGGPDYDPVVAARPLAQAVRDQLAARGVGTTWVVLPADSDLSALPPDAMGAAGWVRAEDANRAQLERVALELEDLAIAGTADTPSNLLRSYARARAAQLRHLAAGD